mmetsp:Transcript_17714/g.57952  ORF Transcript_17714/g.57952 Transcript_17714/m.57952 type:complete len:239 (-) Transcript_17714:667-1383(-)
MFSFPVPLSELRCRRNEGERTQACGLGRGALAPLLLRSVEDAERARALELLLLAPHPRAPVAASGAVVVDGPGAFRGGEAAATADRRRGLRLARLHRDVVFYERLRRRERALASQFTEALLEHGSLRGVGHHMRDAHREHSSRDIGPAVREEIVIVHDETEQCKGVHEDGALVCDRRDWKLLQKTLDDGAGSWAGQSPAERLKYHHLHLRDVVRAHHRRRYRTHVRWRLNLLHLPRQR